ncbi:hypothetical protein [Streptomyces sp. MNU76]|uniref:hypothetical protein n=1 Tax=Streptomyces sp. MNU76 TaxID=2560026 RepID=UPI0027DF9A73|nr:hypothetical protein [Streptomyces sp. MNU76]
MPDAPFTQRLCPRLPFHPRRGSRPRVLHTAWTRTPLSTAPPPPLVRPYLVADEREQARQSRRRLALVLAADFGIDLDRHVVGAEQVVAC